MATRIHPVIVALTKARKERGLSQRELGALAQVSYGSINAGEGGRRQTTLAVLADWAAALGFELHLLPSGEAERRPGQYQFAAAEQAEHRRTLAEALRPAAATCATPDACRRNVARRQDPCPACQGAYLRQMDGRT
jgi:transcriptional regulator with XRE-family HTH domain